MWAFGDVFVDAVQGASNLQKKANMFPWVRWLEHAIELKVSLVNWHINAAVPGINCNGHALGLKEIREMVEAYVKNSEAGKNSMTSLHRASSSPAFAY